MILRVFRVRVRKDRIPEFRKMVEEQSIPWLKNSDGMLGYFPGAPMGEDSNEFAPF